MILDTTELAISMSNSYKDALSVLGVFPISKAVQTLKNFALGFVQLETKYTTGSVSEEEIKKEYKILKYEFELFFLKRNEFTLIAVENIVHSSLSSVAEIVNAAMGFNLIETGKDSSGISLDII